MLEKIMKKINVNNLSRFHKNDLVKFKNIWIISRKGTKLGKDNIKSNNIELQNHVYPNTKCINKYLMIPPKYLKI